jgi:outer membrane receptor protein involved in Fe transport
MSQINLNKYIILLFLIISISGNILQAQSKQNKISGTGKITGKVLDKETNSPLESATIQLFKVKDSTLVTGEATDGTGTINLSVPFGRYRMVVSFIGYGSSTINGIALNTNSPVYDAGTVKLDPSGSPTTAEIQVTAEKNMFESSIDKKIFNVEQSLVSLGGSATDVLKNIPAVTVDADGNVSMRGNSNVKFLVDGKPSGLIGTDPTNGLQQIPANTIARVEIMTNPSAKYDPDGTSGIINIVLKKSDIAGYNGNFSLNTGTEDKYNTALNFNYKSKKFNVFGSYNYRLFNMFGNNVNFRQNIFADSSFNFNQQTGMHNKFNGNAGNLGFDLNIDDKNTLSLSGSYNDRHRSGIDNIFFQELSTNGVINSQYNRESYENHSGNVIDLTLTYDRKFSKPKEDLTAVAYYSSTKDDEVLNTNQQNLTSTGVPFDSPILQNTYTNGKYSVGSIQVDYYHPLGNDPGSDSRYELGFKSFFRNTSADFRSESFDYIQNAFITDALLANNFDYKEQIHSLYGLYAGKINNFGYQVGLRLEEAITNSDLLTTNQSFDKNYFSIFPSLYLSQKFATTNEFQLNYSRRINRPNLRVLNPFIDYSDPLNLDQGNPNLNPEYINSFEFSYIKYFEAASFTSSVFYKQVNDMITRITTVQPNGVSMATFENLNSAKSYGFEFAVNDHIFNWWNLNGNFSYFRMQINGNDQNAALNNDNYSYTAKVISNFNVFKFLDLQVSYNYQGPTVLAQGKMEPVQSFDFAIKKNILNDKGTLGFRISDAFNQQKYISETTGLGFIQDYTRKRTSRMAFLTFSYRFGTDGKQPMKQNKKKDDNNNDVPMDE